MEQTLSSLSIESDKHPSTTSETSQSSIRGRISPRSKQIRVVSRKEIEQLQERVRTEYGRNKKTYDRLLAINPYFSMKLYKPSSNVSGSTGNGSVIDGMIGQIEMLLDDGRVLEKQIMKAQLKQMKKQHQQYSDKSQWKDHYAYIRKIWVSQNQSPTHDSLDTIQQLNKKVVMVKNNLFSMMAHEKQSYHSNNSSQDQYESVNRKIDDMVHETEAFKVLNQKYENLRMAFEDISEQLSNKIEEMNRKVGERNEVIRQVKYENQELKRANKSLKEKLLDSESKEGHLLSKIKDIEGQKKMKMVPSIVLQSPRPQIKSSQLLNLQTIKFQKIQNKQLLLSVKELNISQKNITTNKEQQNDKSFMSPEISKESEQNINSLNQSYIQNRRNQLSDAKSIDGKRGRFVRMRSPVAGKLQKNRESQLLEKIKGDIGSPLPKRRAQQLFSSEG